MEAQQNPNSMLNHMGLNVTEIDTIGEILNISMGAAATAVSILLNRQVSITTPNVQVLRGDEFTYTELEPALGIEIKYIEGLLGSNQMVMSVKDVNTIVTLLLGDDGGPDMDEIHISALGEVMNQMMGASCTALASFLDREINISPPVPFKIEEFNEKLLWSRDQEYIVAVSFKLAIDGLLDSEFFTVMTVPFAKELVSSAGMGMNVSDDIYPVINQDEPQITGHTQVPTPIFGGEFVAENAAPTPAPAAQAAPVQQPVPAAQPAPAQQKPAVHETPAPVQAPAPAPVYASAPAPVPAYASTPAPAPSYASAPVPAPSYAGTPVPAPAYASAPAPAPSYASAPVPAPAYANMPAQAPMYMNAPSPAPAAAYPPMPAAAQRPSMVGGYTQERQAPKQNVTVKPLQFGSLDGDGAFADESDSSNLSLVMGVDLNVTVEIGRTRKQVKEILALRQGSIVELDKQAGAPVDILVNGKLIARGDVVVIDDNFGVRITEIVATNVQR